MTYELDKRGFSRGDLLVFKRTLYEHWAVYAGDDTLIHYNKSDDERSKVSIMEESIQAYWRHSKGGKWPVKEPKLGVLEREIYPEKYSADEIVKRAREYVGIGDYNLLFCNCETFAKWCKYGVKMSEQAQRYGLAASTTTGAWAGVGVGALVGAGVGSVVPVVGTAVGAGVGLVAGSIFGVVGGGPGGWAVNQVIRKKKSEDGWFRKFESFLL